MAPPTHPTCKWPGAGRETAMEGGGGTWGLGPEVVDEADGDAELDVWPRRQAARLRQVQIGKARPEYRRYFAAVDREHRSDSQPRTPDHTARVSKRQFDRALGEWRRRLHELDSPGTPAPHRDAVAAASEAEAHPSSPGRAPQPLVGAGQTSSCLGGRGSPELPGPCPPATCWRR